MSEALDHVAKLVLRESGIRVQQAQHPALRSAIARALPNGDAAAFLVLAAKPVDGPRAIATLIDEVTIKETFFYRDRQQLDTIPWRTLLERAQAAGSQEVTVWCAACATGEEAYTLALLACEAFAPAPPPVRILATDISSAALAASQRGPVSRALAAHSRPELARPVFRAGRRPARRRRPAPEHRHVRTAQPRDRPDAAARRDGLRPGDLPKRAHLLRRRDGRPRDGRASERLTARRHADPGVGRRPLRYRPPARQARADSAPAARRTALAGSSSQAARGRAHGRERLASTPLTSRRAFCRGSQSSKAVKRLRQPSRCGTSSTSTPLSAWLHSRSAALTRRRATPVQPGAPTSKHSARSTWPTTGTTTCSSKSTSSTSRPHAGPGSQRSDERRDRLFSNAVSSAFPKVGHDRRRGRLDDHPGDDLLATGARRLRHRHRDPRR